MIRGGVEPAQESAQEVALARVVAVVLVRGESARVGEGLAGDPERGNEADRVGVVSGMGGGLGHQGADRVVAAQVAPDLLQDQVRGLAAQCCTVRGPR